MAIDAGLPVRAIAIKQALNSVKPIGSLTANGFRVDFVEDDSSVWALFGRETASVALRLAYTWGVSFTTSFSTADEECRLSLASEIGVYEVNLRQVTAEALMIRCETEFTPEKDFSLPDWPRDLYVFGPEFDPAFARGEVHAAQRGFNAGLLHLGLEGFGGVLYFQNYTTLQPYFAAVGLGPDSAVGGQWPELGYSAPTNIDKPLRGAKTVKLLDTFLAVDEDVPMSPQKVCDQFLRLLAGIYLHLDRPIPNHHDWPDRAKITLQNLVRDKRLVRRDYGQLYLRPYVEAEYPDSMVQMSVIAALHGYGEWRGWRVLLEERLRIGMRRFYDSDLKVLRRYLPNVGKDKNENEVDAWYLYHPLKNLGHLARSGEAWARDLFFDSLDFTIKAAKRFNYRWPVKYDLRTLEVTQEERKPGDPGQSDVGGIYAYVMCQAFELTDDRSYLEEAEKAIEGLSHHTFDLLYQSNLTAFGAAACAWLYTLTRQERYIDQCGVFIANLMHNSIIWESEMEHAKSYQTFMGVTCLHDAPYMAAYECFESCAALREVLLKAQDELPEHIRIFAAESSRYALSRSRYFFPDQLPAEAIASEFRNGTVYRNLSIPVEDLYPDGKPAGAVGQEVYGAGAPFVFCIHAYPRLKKGRGMLFCDYPVTDVEEDGNEVRLRVLGPKSLSCRLAWYPEKGASGEFTCDVGKKQRDGSYQVPGDSQVKLILAS